MLKIYKHLITVTGFVLVLWLIPIKAEAQDVSIGDTTVHPSGSAQIIKSLFVPGWGQVNQERLSESLFFYFSTTVYYYRTIFHYYHFKENNSPRHKNLFKINLYAALFLHSLNVMDAATHTNSRGWQGGLLSDKPLKSPWGAVSRSAMLPGWGQLYNGSYWKAAGYFLTDSYLIYKIREADVAYHRDGGSALREERSRYSWYFGIAYLMTMADAYAGAYLYKFEKALKMTIMPIIEKDKLALELYVRF